MFIDKPIEGKIYRAIDEDITDIIKIKEIVDNEGMFTVYFDVIECSFSDDKSGIMEEGDIAYDYILATKYSAIKKL